MVLINQRIICSRVSGLLKTRFSSGSRVFFLSFCIQSFLSSFISSHLCRLSSCSLISPLFHLLPYLFCLSSLSSFISSSLLPFTFFHPLSLLSLISPLPPLCLCEAADSAGWLDGIKCSISSTSSISLLSESGGGEGWGVL